jgi:membrane protein
VNKGESADAVEAEPGVRARIRTSLGKIGIGTRFFYVVKRVAVDTFNEGFTYAGNLAYLSLVTLFPFVIVAAAIAQLVGRSSEGIRTLEAFLQTVPPDVAEVLRKPASDVLQARTGNLLWFGGPPPASSRHCAGSSARLMASTRAPRSGAIGWGRSG